jgi:hypothetical protein
MVLQRRTQTCEDTNCVRSWINDCFMAASCENGLFARNVTPPRGNNEMTSNKAIPSL